MLLDVFSSFPISNIATMNYYRLLLLRVLNDGVMLFKKQIYLHLIKQNTVPGSRGKGNPIVDVLLSGVRSDCVTTKAKYFSNMANSKF